MKTLDKAGIIVFGFLGICSLIGAFWNPTQFFLAFFCALMVTIMYIDLKEEEKK